MQQTKPKSKAAQFHQGHPDVYREFERTAKSLIQQGWAICAPQLVMSQIKQKFNIRIHHKFAGYYARLFEQKNPAHSGFFTGRS